MSWNNYTTLNTSAGHRSSILGVGGGISSAANPAAAMPTASTADDVGLEFDLGTDAQINDDLYRTLRDECTEIDKTLTVTSTNVKNMERSFTQLTKDHNHSRNEMFNYGRNAADELESVTVDEDVRVGFKDQFERLVAPHVVVSPENAVVAQEEDDGVDNAIVIDSHDGNHGSNANNNGTTSPSTTKQCRSFSHKKFITTKKSGSKSKQSSIQTIQKEIKATRKKVKQTDEATSNLSREMNARQLDRVKAESERMVEAKRRELEAETQRNRGVKEAVAVARKNSGAYAQRIHDKVRMIYIKS